MSKNHSERKGSTMQTLTATVKRHRRGGMGDNDYFQALCSCGWKGAPNSNRTIEGRKLAERDARNHRCAS
jgi:hypothetical protein